MDDPLLEFDIPPMQRRRKVLATIYRSFPQSAAPQYEVDSLRIAPPYEQGRYKRMVAEDSQNTCAAVNTITYNLASGGNGSSAGYNSPNSPAWVKYTSGLRPSVGDVACYSDGAGKMDHCGFVIGIVELRKPFGSDGSGGTPQIGWLSADGGQPDRTTEFKDGSESWRRCYNPPHANNREAAFILPRVFVESEGRATVQNLFIFPLAEDGGHFVAGWLDIAKATFTKPAYDENGTEADYKAMKAYLSTFPVRVNAARQADQDVALYSATSTAPVLGRDS